MRTSTKLVCVVIAASLSASHARLRGAASAGLVAPRAAASGSGRSSCPCIGIAGLQGDVFVAHGNATAKYPAEVGSTCAAWDDGRDAKHCTGKDKAPWCAQRWCFVDPCDCDGTGMESPPAPSHMLQAAMSRATPLYYSYATCDSVDVYTAKENKMGCPAAKTEEACDAEGCSWSETEQWGKVCLGLEASGLCGATSKVEEWGAQECPCVGFMGTSGTVQASVGNGASAAFPADVGATCQAWDMERNPDCVGTEKAEGCDQSWCYVDPTKCKGKKVKPATYFHATHSGHQLQYSYETCGSVHPKAPPQGTAKKEYEATVVDPEEEVVAEEWPIRHDIAAALTHDNPTEIANAKKALAAKIHAVKAKTPMEVAREEFAKKHPGHNTAVDHEAFSTEWHSEYENGHVPSWQERHPKAAKSLNAGRL